VFLDGKPIEYAITSTSQSWILDITYSHSIHDVVVYFNGETKPEPFPTALVAAFFVVGFILAAVGFLVYHKRKHRN